MAAGVLHGLLGGGLLGLEAAGALVNRVKSVAVVDADVWGFSIPRMLGIEHDPTIIDEMIVPPEAFSAEGTVLVVDDEEMVRTFVRHQELADLQPRGKVVAHVKVSYQSATVVGNQVHVVDKKPAKKSAIQFSSGVYAPYLPSSGGL